MKFLRKVGNGIIYTLMILFPITVIIDLVTESYKAFKFYTMIGETVEISTQISWMHVYAQFVDAWDNVVILFLIYIICKMIYKFGIKGEKFPS